MVWSGCSDPWTEFPASLASGCRPSLRLLRLPKMACTENKSGLGEDQVSVWACMAQAVCIWTRCLDGDCSSLDQWDPLRSSCRPAVCTGCMRHCSSNIEPIIYLDVVFYLAMCQVFGDRPSMAVMLQGLDGEPKVPRDACGCGVVMSIGG